ncbi:EamA family transporter [Halobacteriovorax sp. HFRX-2_2]|uniref:EamA family transporter n=1 Tax=unclassified Halobacteriovorax TaxID=2639665 RepID=UPI00371D11BD
MKRLILVTVLWAFSFSLIGQYIAGKMDTYLAIFLRLFFAFLVFVPFLNIRTLFRVESLKTMLIGILQIGVMYLFYYNSFKYLSVSEVALFTISTPLIISIIGNIIERRFILRQLFSVILVVFGAAIIKWSEISNDYIIGFLLVQGANISFGLGQVLYRKVISEQNQMQKFALFFLGALIPISIVLVSRTTVDLSQISTLQWGVLLWLGLVASGVCYYLWNTGAKLVSYGELAVMNNAVIPAAILVNVIFWGAKIQWTSFLLGAFIIICGILIENRKPLEY